MSWILILNYCYKRFHNTKIAVQNIRYGRDRMRLKSFSLQSWWCFEQLTLPNYHTSSTFEHAYLSFIKVLYVDFPRFKHLLFLHLVSEMYKRKMLSGVVMVWKCWEERDGENIAPRSQASYQFSKYTTHENPGNIFSDSNCSNLLFVASTQ